MKSPSRYHLRLLTASILAVLLLAAGCSASPSTDEPGEGGNLTSQEQALGSVDRSDGTGSDDPPVFKDDCPQDSVVYKLQLNHQFDYSPNRETDKMQVTGRTSENAWCLVTITGTKVSADDCIVDYDFDGFMQTDDGKCSITGSSTALISIKGECLPSWDGEATIYLEITETGDPDGAAGGDITCPGYSGPYLGFYAPSYFIADFPVSDDPTADSATGPDPGGQFEYLKQYTLIPVH